MFGFLNLGALDVVAVSAEGMRRPQSVVACIIRWHTMRVQGRVGVLGPSQSPVRINAMAGL
jgi:hypothetical protein